MIERFARLLPLLTLLSACEDEIIQSPGIPVSNTPASSGSVATARSARIPPATAVSSASARAPASAAPPEPPFEEQLAKSRPLELAPAEQALGKTKITAEACQVEGGAFVGKNGLDVARGIRVVGNKVYIVDPDDKVRAYAIDSAAKGGCKLAIDKGFGEGGVLATDPKTRALSAAGDVLVASNGVFGSSYVKGGKALYKCEVRPQGYVSLHPSGGWGLGFLANSNVAKVTFTDKECKSEAWALTDLGTPAKRKGSLESVSAIGFVGDAIVVGGIVAKEIESSGPRGAVVLDGTGKEKFRMGSPDLASNADDRLAWVHAIQPCQAGICILDGTLKRISAWTKDGKNVGAVALTKLLGAERVFAHDFQVTKDGTWVFAAVQRDKVRVVDTVLVRIKGL